jgi:hypothetical protein
MGRADRGDVRDEAGRRNPLLVDWDDLPDSSRAINLGAATALPAMLARSGFEPLRR